MGSGEGVLEGLSWASGQSAVFGTANAPGPLGTGWTDCRHGIVVRKWWDVGLSPSSGSLVGRLATAATSVATGSSRSAEQTHVPAMPLWLLCAGSGLVAAVAEGLELGGVDDNLSLPILSATGIWAMLWAWGRVASWWVG